MSVRRHVRECGTAYRGCAPGCPARLADEAEERAERDTRVGKMSGRLVLSSEERSELEAAAPAALARLPGWIFTGVGNDNPVEHFTALCHPDKIRALLCMLTELEEKLAQERQKNAACWCGGGARPRREPAAEDEERIRTALADAIVSAAEEGRAAEAARLTNAYKRLVKGSRA